MEKTLRLVFRNEERRQTTLSIKDPVDPPNIADVEFVMDLILSSDIFETSGGSIIEKVRAEVVGHTVDGGCHPRFLVCL